MQGDAVRARLANEVRSVEEARDGAEGGTLYAVEAAQKLNGDLARLGIASDGGTYLDYFRRLITGSKPPPSPSALVGSFLPSSCATTPPTRGSPASPPDLLLEGAVWCKR